MFLDPLWTRRIAVAIDNWGGGTEGVDASVAIPAEWDDFWSRVRSDAYDVRFCRADGRTPITYKRTTWDHTARSGLFELDAVPSKNATIATWMYYGNAAGTEGATTPTIDTPKTGSIYLGVPTVPYVRAVAEAPSATTARQRFTKTTAEELRVHWDFRSRLVRSPTPIAGDRAYEGIAYVVAIDVLNSSEESQAGMYDTAKIRLGEGLVSTWLKGGTSGSQYSLICKVETTLGRILEARARVQVRNVEV